MEPTLKIDRAAYEMLEEPMIRVPYELMRRNHRAAQRLVEREFNGMSSICKAADKPALEKLREGRERLQGLKRKLSAIQPSASNASPLGPRLKVLSSMDDFETVTPKQDPYRSWTEQRTDRFIVEYLCRTGSLTAAEAYARERQLEDLVDIGLFAECHRIEEALTDRQSCSEALAWCGENRGTLKKTQNDLEFSLRLQEYIELCRKRETTQALAYMKKFISPWGETHMKQVQQAVVLLAFGERTEVKSYRSLYDPARWQALRAEFRATFLSLYGVPSLPLLSLATAGGLASLKLAACLPSMPHQQSSDIPSLAASPPIHNLSPPSADPSMSQLMDPSPVHAHPEHPQRNIDCPTCAEEIAELAKDVPFSHHVNSTIVCRISGQVMDDVNFPMAFPNGYVYSYKALLAMKQSSYDIVTCPRTGEQCSFDRLRKVYIS